MVRIEMSSVKVQSRKAGGFMVTLPAAVAKFLGIEDSEVLKVFVDIEAARAPQLQLGAGVPPSMEP